MFNLHLPPSAFTDPPQLAAHLIAAGFPPPAAHHKAALFASLAAAIPSPTCAFFIPGRIEVLGKHTDYAGGRSLVAALDRGFCLLASPRPDSLFRIIDITTSQETAFPLSPDLSPTLGHWSNYPMTVARRVARNFPIPLRGLNLAFASDLPPAAGMSSSSAFLIACFLALAEINSLSNHPAYQHNIHTPEDLAAYIATIENGQSFGSLLGDKGVGTFGGSEDHTAILCCQPNHLSQYAYCPVRFEQSIPLPPTLTFAIAVSGVIAEKTGNSLAHYNRASRLAADAVAQWNHATHRSDPHLAAALSTSPDAPNRLRQILANHPDLLARFEQFHTESNHIIPSATAALSAVSQGATLLPSPPESLDSLQAQGFIPGSSPQLPIDSRLSSPSPGTPGEGRGEGSEPGAHPNENSPSDLSRHTIPPSPPESLDSLQAQGFIPGSSPQLPIDNCQLSIINSAPDTALRHPTQEHPCAPTPLTTFAHLVALSQSLAETHLKNQIPPTTFLAHSARRLGALAASAFGAGFGGSVWALIPSSHSAPFLAAWQSAYHSAFPDTSPHSTFFPTTLLRPLQLL